METGGSQQWAGRTLTRPAHPPGVGLAGRRLPVVQELGDPERQVERLPGVEARVAHRLVAGAEVGVDQVLGHRPGIR